MPLRKNIAVLGLLLAVWSAGFGQSDTINQKDKNGLKQGKWIKYFENGKTKSISYYKNDTLDGKYISYFGNGNINSQVEFKNGLRNGALEIYRLDGTMDKLFVFNMEKKVVFQYYDEKGNISYEEIFNSDGIKISHNFYKDGKLIK